MRVVLQRVDGCSVSVGQHVAARFSGLGLLLLVGAALGDELPLADAAAEKAAAMRVFDPDLCAERGLCPPAGARELSALDLGLPVMVISQFTLLADVRKGRRPSWHAAMPGQEASPIVARVAERLRELDLPVHEGVFGADMAVTATNAGPVTIVFDL
ncbi:MAG: D-aminoacyl-tRNA deacylase [Actinobacteria bacterium]|nr:D-aminoacyl-tRNA deacylase [Actinomycetota bacterium]